MNRIAFDIDGCCLDFMSVVTEKVWRRTGKDVSKHKTFNISKEFDIPPGLFWNVIRDVYSGDEVKAYEGAFEVLSEVAKMTKRPILFVTGRSYVYSKETYKSLMRNFPKLQFHVAFAGGFGSDKNRFLQDLDFFYEDRRKTVIKAMEVPDLKVVFPSRSYNTLDLETLELWYKRLYKVEGILDILSILKEA